MFHTSQHGFRNNISTVLQLLTFLQTACKNQDGATDIETVFTDFSKAFDRVDHGIFLMKLFKNGGRSLIKFLKSYLLNRSQSVECNIRPEDTYRRKIKLSPKTTG